MKKLPPSQRISKVQCKKLAKKDISILRFYVGFSRMVLKRICIQSIPQTALYHYRVCFGLPLMNLVPRNSRLGWLMQVVTSLPHIDGGINVRRKVSFLHSLSIKPGPFQGDPPLKYITASFLPSPPLPAPFSQGF